MNSTRTALALCFVALVGTARAGAPLPAQQQAIVQNGHGGPEVLTLQTVPVLAPAAGQVLLRVYAAGVNPVDWKIREGNGHGPSAATAIPGFDVAGVVVKLGPGASQFHVGEAVFGRVGPDSQGLNGAYAQYALARTSSLVPKPQRLTYAEAAGLGVAGGTAERMIERTRVHRGQRVLVTGVAGGVGSSAAQLAKARGAYVIGTASARHAGFLKSIGVDQVIDYTQGNFADQVRDIDVVLDTVGGDTTTQALATLKRGGVLQSVAGSASEAACSAAVVTCINVGPAGPNDRPEGELLAAVAALAARGKFQVHIEQSFPLAQAAAAQEANRQGHTEGKIILAIDPLRAERH